jgi:hypothetical protein
VPGTARAAVPGSSAGAVRSRHVFTTARPAPAVVAVSVTAAVIAASAAYNAALAAGLTGYSARGEAPPGQGLGLAGFVVMWLAAAILAGAAAGNARIGGWPVIAAVTALAVATVVARYYSPDAYHLNTDDRIGDHYPGTRIAVLAALAAIAAVDLVLCAVVVSGEGYNN